MADYSKTVHLPQTAFPMKANLSQREPEFLKLWEEKNVYQAILDKNQERPAYILHDGPPYANGHIHLGTALNKILKDMVVKYKAFRGYRSPYVPGWDCHGMPIEHQVFQELKLDKRKTDRVAFRKKAGNFARKFQEIQKEEFKRLGILGDWENSYLTLAPEYEASIIKTFGQLALAGFIYRAFKPIHWCLTCETALAEAEIEYEDDKSPSIYVAFPVKPEFREKFGPAATFLIWTTTPWTLPANAAIALHPEFRYSLVETPAGTFFLAGQLLAPVLEKRKLAGKVLQTYSGRELAGVMCTNPLTGRDSVIVLAEYVSGGEGTGCVHTAPGHGEEDYYIGLKYNLPILSPVDNQGRFTEEVPELKGIQVFQANAAITTRLKEKGVLYHQEETVHSYPHCWRCKEPVIFRSTRQWFLKIDFQDLRRKMQAEIGKTCWVPAEGANRISSMVETRPDWCLSRQRLWGVPIPVFYCTGCGQPVITTETLDRLEQLVRENGSDILVEKTAEELLPENFSCPHCQSKEFSKEQDILDVWFDSGVSHFAVLARNPELTWPADLYLEGSDQHRGWFQTSLITACGVAGQAPFRTVITHGFVVDSEGRKMSKSLGNVITPEEVIRSFGAEILRLWVASEDYQQDVRISDSILKNLVTTYRGIRNTLRFLLGNLHDFSPEQAVAPDQLPEVDRWALEKLRETVRRTTGFLEDFLFYKAQEELYNFCNVYLSSFYLDYLKDRLYTYGKNSKERKSGQTVLSIILLNLLVLLAPMLSFTAEEAYQCVPWKKKASVFLEDWPALEEPNKELLEQWERFLEFRKVCLKKLEEKRESKVIGSSLGAKLHILANQSWLDFLGRFPDLHHLLMVSEITLARGEDELAVFVEKSPYQKCARCWIYAATVGQNSQHPELCEKCVGVMENRD